MTDCAAQVDDFTVGDATDTNSARLDPPIGRVPSWAGLPGSFETHPRSFEDGCELRQQILTVAIRDVVGVSVCANAIYYGRAVPIGANDIIKVNANDPFLGRRRSHEMTSVPRDLVVNWREVARFWAMPGREALGS